MTQEALRYGITSNPIPSMQGIAENLLNPLRYRLSEEAKKRLRWMYFLEKECQGNVTHAAVKIGISRQWLSGLQSTFKGSRRDPRSLEPASRAPRSTLQRKRISKETEEKILEIRAPYGWGKDKIASVLLRDWGLKAGPSTCNRYLHKHLKIDPKLSEKNKHAWAKKKEREGASSLKVKYRPPRQLKDYQPGALVEKDMKFIPAVDKQPAPFNGKYHTKDFFHYEHGFIDTFTRIRAMELTKESDSCSAASAYRAIQERLPFPIASMNTDNGGENGKHVAEQLTRDDVVHFYSRTGTPTDNPRVERAFLTDDQEFYGRGNLFRSFQDQQHALRAWEHTYNYVRPHQALGNLTPMAFYQLWKQDPGKAYAIKNKYQTYLAQQGKRLASARRLQRAEQIESLMHFIDAKLNQKVELSQEKLALVNCQLCSWT